MQPKILAVLGDRFHPAKVLREGLAPLANRGFTLDCIDNPEEMPWARLGEYQTIILSKGGYHLNPPGTPDWIGDHTHLLSHYVQMGGGLIFLHSGMAGFDQNPGLLRLSKASFVQHPPGIVHVLHTGLDDDFGVDFESDDELYFMRFTEEPTDLFLESNNPEHGSCRSGWRHSCGKGRIVSLTPGHTLSTLLNEQFQGILVRSLRWCCGA